MVSVATLHTPVVQEAGRRMQSMQVVSQPVAAGVSVLMAKRRIQSWVILPTVIQSVL